MKHVRLIIFFLFLVVLVIQACSKAKEELLKPVTNTCDTTDVKYATDILPILQSNCYSCHGNGETDGGISLGNYEGVKAKAGSGELFGAVSHAAGFSPMPEDAPKLSDCDINKIKCWIDHGALNN